MQISHGTYKGYELVGEKNGREPSIDMIRRIAVILDVNLDYLMGLED
ncbi:MAG: helix-turn-helix domain-containing protein [Firmicutes bacterium]|nr:helix-turn-helix domain-containing protein [Bacillota bacterium]